MFHIQSYFAALGVNALNTALAAVADTIFSDRNGAFIYTEPWAIAAAFAKAPNLLRVRSSLPKLNAIGRHHIFGINRSATVPSPLNLQDMRKEPLALSLNEPLLWEGSNNLGAATEDTVVHQCIVPPDWTMELPEHLQRITVRAIAAPVGVANAWSADVPVTFPDQDLRGGVYSIVGAQVQAPACTAFRFILPRQKPSQGRLLRPGGICLDAINNIPDKLFNSGMGEWGRFHTFELPRLMLFANAAGAVTPEIRFDLLYLGEDTDLLMGTM